MLMRWLKVDEAGQRAPESLYQSIGEQEQSLLPSFVHARCRLCHSRPLFVIQSTSFALLDLRRVLDGLGVGTWGCLEGQPCANTSKFGGA